jgi:hypothetical protein
MSQSHFKAPRRGGAPNELRLMSQAESSDLSYYFLGGGGMFHGEE